MTLIATLENVWQRRPPALPETIASVERTLGLVLPDDYKQLLCWSNGGEGRLGRALFSFWPIEAVADRNRTARITHYMSARFLGIGTNGGGECYALDYTADGIPPFFAIVPLGDLGPEQKTVIAPSLTKALEQASLGQFDDGEYNLHDDTEPSAEIRRIIAANIRARAENAWHDKNYRLVVELLEPIQATLTATECRKLAYARKKAAR